MDILVACHNESEDAKLFIYNQPQFDAPVKLEADYVDPYSSNKRWEDYLPASKDIIWTQHCPLYHPFSKIHNYFYHDSIFYNLFDDGWNILKPGGSIIIPFDNDFRSLRNYSKKTNATTALLNFKTVLKKLLSKHPWISQIVKREHMPFIISEQFEQETHNEYIVFSKPTFTSNSTRKHRKSRRVKTRRV